MKRRSTAIAPAVVFYLSAATAWTAPLPVTWADLVPPAVSARAAQAPTGVVTHEQGAEMAPRDRFGMAPVRGDLDGLEVSLIGYVVPLALDGIRLKDFLIAPYVGACVHVPPPPSNQLVLTHFRAGIEMSMRLFTDPVVVTGRLSTTAVETDLGEQGSYTVGYQLDAARVTFASP
ncbi:MAG: DUF3299 domain-containing protein [Bauldia sp.]